jgi:hypothetical protein
VLPAGLAYVTEFISADEEAQVTRVLGDLDLH